MSARTSLVMAAVGVVALVGCSSPRVGIEGRPPTVDTGNIVGPEVLAVAPKPLGPADHFGDGKFEVLVDIKPGEYKTPGPQGLAGAHCYWARLKDTRGEITSLATSDYGNTGPDIVTILPSDKAFQSHDCGEWRLQP